MKLTIYFHLLLTLRISGAIYLPPPPHVSMAWEGIHVRLSVYSVIHVLKLPRMITKMIPVMALISLCLIAITRFFKC